MFINRFSKIDFIVVVLPCVVYAIHAFQFGPWVVDDAGISFSYARHLAQGYGLVSQPGMMPVEGYSNFTWVVLLAPTFLLHAFDPVVTPKLISFILIAATFAMVYMMLKPIRGGHWIAFVALNLTALNTSFVIWTISGLENALYMFLVALMLWGAVQITADGQATLPKAILIGVLVALTGMTRPDGLAYTLAFPMILVPARKIGWRNKCRLLLVYGSALALCYGAFILFRLAYFGAPLPNTYYVKGGPKVDDLLNLLTLQASMLNRIQRLLRSILGLMIDLLPLILVGGTLYLVIVRNWSSRAWAIVVYMLCSLSVYLLLPPDWMGEYRFATVFFLLFYLYIAFIGITLLSQLPQPLAIVTQTGLVTLAIASTINWFIPRTEAFSRNPTVSFQGIKREFSDKFVWYKQTLGLSKASVMLPDIGAVIYYSDLTVYDLVGLTDQSVAHYLGKDIDRPGFYNYVFETVKPTFIHTHGFWTHHARLEDDPRFAQLYLPICTYIDPWVEQNYQVKRHSGDFVLRSIAETHPNELSEIQQRLDTNCNLK